MGGPRKAAPRAATPAEPETAEPAELTVIAMNITITGSVDGQEWPARGGEIALPTAEAERYVRLGYAHLPE